MLTKILKATMLVLVGYLIYEVPKAIENLVWLSSQPPLPKNEYPLGIFSTPGGGLLFLLLIIGVVTLVGIMLTRRVS